MKENVEDIRTPNLRLRRARVERGWTQKQVALAVHKRWPEVALTENDIRRWENGKRHPGPFYRYKLCDVFGMTADDLGLLEEELVDEPIWNASTQTEGAEQPLITLTSEQASAMLQVLNLGESIMENFDPSKRTTLEKIKNLLGVSVASSVLTFFEPEPWQRLGFTSTKPATINNDTIQHFNHLLNTCRALSNGSELKVAEGLLDTFLPRLQEAAPYQLEVAGLASEGLLLKSIFIAHNLDINAKIAICQKAIEHARQSKNPNLIASGLLQLGVAFHYGQQPENAMKSQQEALHYINQVSPLVQSHIYTEAAATLAQFARGREADFYIHLAYETFPAHAEKDSSFAFDDHGFFNLALYKGIMYTHLAQPEAAWEAFEEHKKSTDIPERMRLEIINHQGKAAILSGDLDKYFACLEDGLTGAVALNSKKRFDEAFNIFRQDVPTNWYKEPLIRPLIEQYQLLPAS